MAAERQRLEEAARQKERDEVERAKLDAMFQAEAEEAEIDGQHDAFEGESPGAEKPVAEKKKRVRFEM